MISCPIPILLPITFLMIIFWMTLSMSFKVKGHFSPFVPVTWWPSHLEAWYQVPSLYCCLWPFTWPKFGWPWAWPSRSNVKVKGNFHTSGHIRHGPCHLEAWFQVLSPYYCLHMASLVTIWMTLRLTFNDQMTRSKVIFTWSAL